MTPKTDERKFNPQSFDSRVWAKEFMGLYNKNIMKRNHLWIDEGLMVGWFANAIMAGFDEAHRRISKDFISKERVRGLKMNITSQNPWKKEFNQRIDDLIV